MKSKKTTSVLLILSLITMSFVWANPDINSTNNVQRQGRGIFIAGAGISGAGKTSVFTALKKMLNSSKLYVMPEEDEWSDILKNRADYDRFTVLTEGRNLRIPNYKKADETRENGGIALMDAPIDIIFPYMWLGSSIALGFEKWDKHAEEMISILKDYPKYPTLAEWLFSLKEDQREFGRALRSLYEADMKNLAKPDVIVMFEVEFELWKKNIFRRNRSHDMKTKDNFEEYYRVLEPLGDAVTDLVNTLNVRKKECSTLTSGPVSKGEGQKIVSDPNDPDCVRKIVLKVEDSSPSAMAEKLLVLLLKEKVIFVKDVNFDGVSVRTCEKIADLMKRGEIEHDSLVEEILCRIT